MPRSNNEIPDLKKEVNRWTASLLNKTLPLATEEVVAQLQHLGPSWTGRYSNSWQIRVGKEKSTGTRRPGEPKRVKAPKMNVKSIREGRLTRDTIEYEITNLARSKGYAQDTRLGRFRRGKAGNKNIGDKPRTQKGQRSLEFDPTSRLQPEDYRGFKAGTGKSSGFSSQTAPLNWFQTYLEGGKLKDTLELTLNSSLKKFKGKHLK